MHTKGGKKTAPSSFFLGRGFFRARFVVVVVSGPGLS